MVIFSHATYQNAPYKKWILSFYKSRVLLLMMLQWCKKFHRVMIMNGSHANVIRSISLVDLLASWITLILDLYILNILSLMLLLLLLLLILLYIIIMV